MKIRGYQKKIKIKCVGTIITEALYLKFRTATLIFVMVKTVTFRISWCVPLEIEALNQSAIVKIVCNNLSGECRVWHGVTLIF